MTPIAWVETNCFWCKSDDVVRDRLTTLWNAGAGNIWLSTDPYHQQYVPIENVKRAYRIGVEVFGDDGVIVHDREYLKAPEKWSDAGEYAQAHPPMLMGRAYRDLRQYMPRKPLAEYVSEHCEDQVSPQLMHETHINPDGSVMAFNCSGVIIGDLADKSLSDIFCGNDWRQNDILRTLANKGPVGLLQMAPDFQPKETYAQKCELCWEVRSHLARFLPDTLAPAECYTGI